jgi:itaconate CoA-transferase
VVLRRPELPGDSRFCSSAARVENLARVDQTVADVFITLTSAEAIDRLTTARTAFGSVNSVQDLIAHPQLRAEFRPSAVEDNRVQGLKTA